MALTARLHGRRALVSLIDRVFKWDVPARFYLFALLYIAVIKLVVALLHRLITDSWPRFGNESFYAMIGAIMISVWAQAGEEIGWRGFALPRLADAMGLGAATVVLGVIWALWHLPLFFFADASYYHQSFPLYALQVTALSVAMGWLYWQSQGSLLLVMLMHAAVNNTKDIVPSADLQPTSAFALSDSLVAWLTLVLLWLLAALFLYHMRRGRLT